MKQFKLLIDKIENAKDNLSKKQLKISNLGKKISMLEHDLYKEHESLKNHYIPQIYMIY